MMCQPLKKLFDVCRSHQFQVIQADVIRVACLNCQQLEVCPALSVDEYESRKIVNLASPETN